MRARRHAGSAASLNKPLYTPRDFERVVAIAAASDAKEQYRTPWRRDYARLIHCAAFRRLQGKLQLFPSQESDFFRNRLTHSLEVAQIAKSIALRVNSLEPYFSKNNISTDLVETAALAHDLGHPPFGHNGEEALNACMSKAGGFEGNAQTLRILSKLEKRETLVTKDSDVKDPTLNGRDNRAGLNLTYRTLASVLKYDSPIPHHPGPTVQKGYYFTESALVDEIKEHVGRPEKGNFKTIECSIMDIADDIAYSTYDLEDSFKAGFLSPISIWAADPKIVDAVAEKVKKRIDSFYPELTVGDRAFASGDVLLHLHGIFSEIFEIDPEDLNDEPSVAAALISDRVVSASNKMQMTGYYRTKFTSDLVGELIRGISVTLNKSQPALSAVRLEFELFKKMEVLKNFTYIALIMSPRLKIAEHRGKDIVKSIFDALMTDNGYHLMPEDFQLLYQELEDTEERRRVVCDFIAGMTDRYAVNFYSRLFGTNPESFFTPL